MTILSQWNVLLFIFGLMCLSGAAEESGAFSLVAEYTLRYAGGSLQRLFVLLFLAGALLTMLLSNDATAIVFTPIVYRAMTSRGIDAMPFLFACTFVADTASFGLPFANPANVLVLPRPHALEYLGHLAVPQVAAIAINLGLFLLLFRNRLRGRYVMEGEEAPHPAASRTLAAVCAVAAAYAVALALEWPLGPVAVAGALATVAVARIPVQRVLRHVSWRTFALLVVLFVVVDLLSRTQFFGWTLHELDLARAHGTLAGVAGATLATALLSMLLNNLPVAVLASYVAAHASWHPIAYALIPGIDLGPNLTPFGSLSTILWLGALRRRGVTVSPLQYVRLGAIVVPPMLAVTILWLWLLAR